MFDTVKAKYHMSMKYYGKLVKEPWQNCVVYFLTSGSTTMKLEYVGEFKDNLEFMESFLELQALVWQWLYPPRAMFCRKNTSRFNIMNYAELCLYSAILIFAIDIIFLSFFTMFLFKKKLHIFSQCHHQHLKP